MTRYVFSSCPTAPALYDSDSGVFRLIFGNYSCRAVCSERYRHFRKLLYVKKPISWWNQSPSRLKLGIEQSVCHFPVMSKTTVLSHYRNESTNRWNGIVQLDAQWFDVSSPRFSQESSRKAGKCRGYEARAQKHVSRHRGRNCAVSHNPIRKRSEVPQICASALVRYSQLCGQERSCKAVVPVIAYAQTSGATGRR